MSATLPGALLALAETRGDDIAFREKEYGIWQEITWHEAAGRVRHFALGLAALGVEAGDRIAIIVRGRPRPDPFNV